MFLLEPDQDLERLQEQILEAVGQGAGFVRFESVGRGSITVLVTPLIRIRFESLERSPEQIEAWELDPPRIDVTSDYPEEL
jgi:hypothetical protein